MPLRSPKDQLAYIKYRRKNPDGCGFCDAIHSSSEQVVAQHATMTVLRNKFPYVSWDALKVTDHLMIVPVRHIDGMETFTADERRDFIHVMTDYESKGYSFYLRSTSNGSRTMHHLHGHLIQTA